MRDHSSQPSSIGLATCCAVWMILSVAVGAVLGVPAASGETPNGEIDWAARYEELEARVLPNIDEPKGYPADLEPYFEWMERKAVDRDAVKQAREDAFDAAHGNPEWAAELDALLQQAQRSGEGTVWDACWKFLRMKKDDTWQDTLRKARDYGRKIYEKAAETNFDPVFVRDAWARCLLRYSINVVEGEEDAGLALYTGRVNVLAEWGEDGLLRIPRRDFDVSCERRTEFVMEQKGEPHAPADMGLEWVEDIRKECDWWSLGRERADATELMNQFLKDDLCLRPQEQSHKWYIELAGKYDGLEEAKEYAEGFYATLKGTVWIEEAGQRRPASGARVTVTDPKDGTQWQATADPEGEYRIEDALLHTHEGDDDWPRCPVFQISAEHEGDRVDDTYEGTLREPDKSAEHTKDLVIQHDDRWELEIEYHEQVSYTTREQHGDATLEEHISGTLDYRITATLRPASWQPADALRPYEDKEQEAKERLVEPRPTGVPGIPDDQRWQIERIEAEEARMRARANEVVGPGGRQDFIALGVELQLKDDFVHTRNWTIGTVEDDYRGEWHADQQGPIPLNIRLTTHANKNSYHITLTDHDPMDTGNPETHHPFTIPWRYLVRHTLGGQSKLNCSGTAEVEGNYPNIVFADVPDDKLAYDGSQRVLRGEHSWTEGASELDVSGMETLGCSDKRALRSKNRVFPADSMTKTLKWTLRRLGGPGGS
jgi:hypothetical protein